MAEFSACYELNGFQISYVADAHLSTSSVDWVVPVALLPAMLSGNDLRLRGPISPTLAVHLDHIQDIYHNWLGLRRVCIFAEGDNRDEGTGGSSAFFSGGVDSFYSVLKHINHIDNLIFVHGFDIFLPDKGFFEKCRASIYDAARMFGKRLVTVTTNIRQWSGGFEWSVYHGPVLASVAHLLAPIHSVVYIGSSYPYRNLHPWGSNPLLDPLWSSQAVRVIHDGSENDRVGKLRFISQWPEALRYLRVCWESNERYNCGQCEKCLRTMIALEGLGLLSRCGSLPHRIDFGKVRSTVLDDASVLFWRELRSLDLTGEVRRSVDHVISNYEWRLPPGGSIRGTVARYTSAAKQIARLGRVLLS